MNLTQKSMLVLMCTTLVNWVSTHAKPAYNPVIWAWADVPDVAVTLSS